MTCGQAIDALIVYAEYFTERHLETFREKTGFGFGGTTSNANIKYYAKRHDFDAEQVMKIRDALAALDVLKPVPENESQ